MGPGRTASSDRAKVQVAGRAETGATVRLGEEESQLASGRVGIDNGTFVERPVVFGRIAVVIRGIHHDTREVGESMLLNVGQE